MSASGPSCPLVRYVTDVVNLRTNTIPEWIFKTGNDKLALCMLGNFSWLYSILWWLFFSKLTQKIISGTLSECQTVWIQIRADILWVLIWVKSVRLSADDKSPHTHRKRWLNSMSIWAPAWDFQQCGMCDQQRLRPTCAYAQSGQSLC